MSGLAFVHPKLLLLLAAVAATGALGIAAAEHKRRADLASYGEGRLLVRGGVLPGRGRRLVAAGLALLSLCLALVALARPQYGAKPVVLSRTGRDVLFVLDLSRSMNAEDVLPSRLEAARRLVQQVLEASPGDRVGLAVFGGSAFLEVPLTLDRAAFDLFLGAARTDDVSDPGTNLAAALDVAATAFGKDSEPRYRVVVLLSDGEGLSGDPTHAIQALREAGTRVFAVGVGTTDGAPIPERSGSRLIGYHRDDAGGVVVTRLEEEVLRRVASETDGRYLRLRGATARELESELAHLDRREISSRTFTQLVDRYQVPLGVAVAILFVEGVVQFSPRRRSRRRRKAAALVLAVAGALLTLARAPLAAQAPADASEGERLYRAGRFQEAYDAFRGAVAKSASPPLRYNMGNALYRLGRYDAAAGSFRDALGDSSAIREPSIYNLGNALVKGSESQPDRREDLRRAVTAYEQALLLSPADRDAKWNLELALRKLREEEKKRESGGKGGQGRQPGAGESKPDSTGTSPSQAGGQGGGRQAPRPQSEPQPAGSNPQPAEAGLTEEQAKQLLEAIQGEEGEVLDNRDQGRAQVSGGKDW